MSVFLSIKQLIDRSIVKNVLGLYGIQIAGYLLPLLTIPYLSRVLNPYGLGIYLFAQTYAVWASIVIEYGFNLSAARDIARNRLDKEAISTIVSGVLAAKVILSLLTVLVAGLVGFLLPIYRQHRYYLIFTLVYILALGFSCNWYFQGKEKMLGASIIELFARGLTTIALFLMVNHSDDVGKALAINATTSWISTGVQIIWMKREVNFFWPPWAVVHGTLKGGWDMFLYRGVSAIYANVNTLIIGITGSPNLVGYYGAAEKLVRACLSLFNPIFQALYPRMSDLTYHDPRRACLLFRLTFIIISSTSIGLMTIVIAGASTWIDLFVGHEYQKSVNIIRVLSGLIPVSTIIMFLTLQLFCVHGAEKVTAYSSIFAFVCNVALTPIVLFYYSIEGVACSAVLIEFAQLTFLLWLARKRRVCRA